MTTWQYAMKLLVTAFGIRRRPYVYSFKDNEAVSPRFERNIPLLVGADYVNLLPTTYLVATAPDGAMQNLKGGYVQLKPGRYSYHLVDKRDRTGTLAKINETTLDGAMVSLVIMMTYKVVDPLRVMDIQYPIETLFSTLQSDVKEYIRTHRFEEIVGSNDTIEIDPDRMIRHIRQAQNNHHQISRAFVIVDLMVKEREVDSRLMEIRKNLQVQQGEKDAEGKLFAQRRELEMRIASQEAEMNRLKAENEVQVQEILKKKRMLEIELDRERDTFRMKQERWSRAVGALERAFSMPNYPQGTGELKLIQEIITALKQEAGLDPTGAEAKPAAEQRRATSAPEDRNSKLDDLTSTLLGLLERKKRP